MKYVVCAFPYDPNSGGGMFLHRLVHELNELGETAVLWPFQDFWKDEWSTRFRLFIRPSSFTRRGLNTPVEWHPKIDDDTIVIYPEIVLGNPLNAKNVVRWLLYYDPKRHYEFGADDFFVRVDKNFDHPAISGDAPDLFLYEINPAYRDEGRKDRKGACFMVRKGGHKPRIPQTEGAEQLDEKSHEEIAAAFNRCEVFYCYDEATMYSQYAALCGCLSVVIPGSHTTREAWVDGYEIARYGIAYGLDDLDHARETMHLVRPLLEARSEAGIETVRNLVSLTKNHFAKPAKG